MDSDEPNELGDFSEYTYDDALSRLKELGVDPDDYYKIPVENTEISKIEKQVPKKTKITSKHTVIIDSRQRDYSLYPTPDKYFVTLIDSYKYVERIELIAAMIPKTEYNVNTENNMILLTINGITSKLFLREGQYTIGINTTTDEYLTTGAEPTYGLIKELKDTLNKHSLANNNFNVFLATVPINSGGTGNNASILNRIVVTHLLSDFTIDFTNTNFNSGSPFRLLGFTKAIINSTTIGSIYGSSNTGICSENDLLLGNTHVIDIPSIISTYDYDLHDDPDYIILDLDLGTKSGARVESLDVASDRKFAVIIYDSNEADNIQTINASKNTDYLKLKADRKPGRMKALKGTDFDKKILKFSVAMHLDAIGITFTKYDTRPYNFHNREHMLTFEIDVIDFDPNIRF